MCTTDEPLGMYFEGFKLCTRFRRKLNTSSVYLKIDSLPIPFISVKIVGRKDNSIDFINYTYKTESFPLLAGKKYLLYNLSPANQEIRLEFQGPLVHSLKGVWSPDSVYDPECITIGPEYKNEESSEGPNTIDSTFSYSSTYDGQEFITEFRNKRTNSSIYLNLMESSFSDILEVKILGNNGPGTEEENCTYKKHFLQLNQVLNMNYIILFMNMDILMLLFLLNSNQIVL